ncbi:formylglycine-generating enzyme family protein [Dysgonomonas sp.]
MKRKMINTFLFASILSAITALTGSCSSNDDNYTADTEAPAEVTFLSGISTDGQVTLNWTDPADNDFERVEISYPQESTPIMVEKGGQTATITGLINGTVYIFTLKTMDITGNKSTGVATSHTPIGTDPDDVTPPEEVSGLSGTAGNMQVVLHWTDPTDADFTKVGITYSPGGTTAVEVGKGAQTAVITGLSNDTEYTFTLKTVDASGNESAGISSEPFTPTAPDFPQSGELKTFTVNGVQFTMIAVEGGTFTMGSNAEAAKSGVQRENQANEHQVTLSSYWIGETEVTIALWNAVMGSGGGSNTLPIASITRNQSVEFAHKLNVIAHEQGLIPDDVNFQIPTEAQWEFAAKGGNKSKGYTYSGSNTLSQVGWTSSDGSSVHAVKQKLPNELGIYDMSGNVYEWVYDMAAPYTTTPKTNPCNTSGSQYIKRGGSFYYNDAYRFTSTYRYFYGSTDYTIGTRLCLY